ncbi:MAG: hypothetical protein M0017_05645 [Desulfobacteraceae bacterium]|nr:hypothetical protein [Desulfobacteraceae bacterium]
MKMPQAAPVPAREMAQFEAMVTSCRAEFGDVEPQTRVARR